ncbi:MAG: hypothetical protein U0326_33615 [Polyangiales bacterium]
MPDCSTCEAFSTATQGSVQPCLASGTQALSATPTGGGLEQFPLMHLLYAQLPQLAVPKGDAAKWYLSQRLTARCHRNVVNPRDLGGMVLAQSIHILPTWAQLGRDDQWQMLQTVCALAYSSEPVDVSATSLLAQLNGVGPPGERSLFLKARASQVAERKAQLAAALQSDPVALLKREYDAQAALILQRAEAIKRDAQGRVDRFPMEHNARLTTLVQQIRMIEQAHAMGLNPTPEAVRDAQERHAVLIEEYNDEQKRTPESLVEEIKEELADQQRALEQLVGSWEHALAQTSQLPQQFKQELELLSILDAQWKAEIERELEADRQEKAAFRLQAQQAALDNDYGLQLGNYDPSAQPHVQLLRTALTSSATARQVYLFLHPKLKYEWTVPTLCRMAKMLSDGPFLAAWDELADAGLLQPGPHAKLGVAVMNSLAPGAYGNEHRGMVQRELDELVDAMEEFGLGRAITCHSCGATEFADRNALGWIRDHNPPTSLVNLKVTDAMGLRRYARNSLTATRQILLPQCLQCSTQQSSIAAKATAILDEGLNGSSASAVKANPRAYLMAALTDPSERQDLARLVLNPGVGWSQEVQNGTPQAIVMQADGTLNFTPTVDLSALGSVVTTGGSGSFAGIDEDALATLGATLGCHTCIDVPVQNDPYRGISWIADHQPPTALVARGLMEMPQIVFPHCHRCSKTQSQRVRKLCGIFDGCFGSAWADVWTAKIRDAGYGA